MKTAIVLLADPNGGDEALGRLFNALAATYDFQQHGHEVEDSSSRAPARAGSAW